MKLKGTKNAPKMLNGAVKKPKKSKKLEAAEEAVEVFEEMLDTLGQLNDYFEKTYPAAAAELETINRHRDEMEEQAAACKLLVRDAGTTVGNFICMTKETTPCYRGEKLLELMSSLSNEEAGALFKELHERGLISDIKVDKAASAVVRNSDAELRDRLAPAWDKGGQKMTPAVTVPKF